MSRTLRAVGPDEKPKMSKLLSLAQAVEGGDYLEILRAQRRDIVAALPGEKGPAVAALHRQLALLSKEIEGLEAKAVEDADDDYDEADDEEFDASAI